MLSEKIFARTLAFVFLVGLIVVPASLNAGPINPYDWTSVAPGSGEGSGIATDGDGSRLLVGGTRLYLSSDYGSVWSETQPAGDTTGSWGALALDSDGTNVIAGDFGGRLYIGTNFTKNWTETQPAGDTDKDWTAVDTDSDGSHLIAAVINGRVYVSDDSGTTWAETQPAGDTDVGWTFVASDADGSHLFAGVSSGRLYVSSNGGTSWTETQPAGDVNAAWSDGDIDADGSHLITAVNGGRVYISANGGTSWSETPPIDPFTDYNWVTVATDKDGSALFAGVSGASLYTSIDSGISWAETLTSGGVSSWRIVSDSDGSNPFRVLSTTFAMITTYGHSVGRAFPYIDGFSPAEGGVVATTTDIEITFNSDVIVGSGSFDVYKASDDSLVESIDVSSNQVSTTTTTFTIDLTDNLETETEYYVLIDPGIAEDENGLSFFGIDDTTTWNFTSADETSPTVAYFFVADDTTNVNVRLSTFEIGFNETAATGTGNVILKGSNGDIIETIDVTSSSVAALDTTSFAISLSTDLDYLSDYFFTVDNGAFTDSTGNAFPGFQTNTTWNFTTEERENNQTSGSRRFPDRMDQNDTKTTELDEITEVSQGTIESLMIQVISLLQQLLGFLQARQ